MIRATTLLLGAAPSALLTSAALHAEDPAKAGVGEKHLLRYHFKPGETIRWRVEHLAKVKTTVAGVTQTAETVSRSIKAWTVTDVTEQGSATFEHRVEHVDMRSKISGRQEVVYNSKTDEEPPAGFETVAASVGKVLSRITLNSRGEVIGRKDEHTATTSPNEGQVTMTLPEEPVAIGQTWSFPYEMVIPANNGTVVKIKTQQKYSVEQVKNGVATIRMSTVILTPVHDPAIEAQLIQRQSEGTIRFDIKAGRVLSQQMDLDKSVVGFAGKTDASSLHYLTRFTEELVTDAPPAEERVGKGNPYRPATTAARSNEGAPERK